MPPSVKVPLALVVPNDCGAKDTFDSEKLTDWALTAVTLSVPPVLSQNLLPGS